MVTHSCVPSFQTSERESCDFSITIPQENRTCKLSNFFLRTCKHASLNHNCASPTTPRKACDVHELLRGEWDSMENYTRNLKTKSVTFGIPDSHHYPLPVPRKIQSVVTETSFSFRNKSSL